MLAPTRRVSPWRGYARIDGRGVRPICEPRGPRSGGRRMRTFHILMIGAFLVPFLVVDHYRQGERAAVAATAPARPKLPIGVSEVLYAISVPAPAAPTPERVRLGEKLFFDKRLSADDSVSC